MQRLLIFAVLSLLSGCGEWPDLPTPPDDPAVAPQLLPIDAFSPYLEDPDATAQELAARAAALNDRADALRAAQP